MTKQAGNTNKSGGVSTPNRYASIMEEVEMIICFYDREIEHEGDQLTDMMIKKIYQQLLNRVRSIKPLGLALQSLPRLSCRYLTELRSQIAEELLEPQFEDGYAIDEIVSALQLLINSLELWTNQRPDGRGYMASIRDRYDDILPMIPWEIVPVTKNPPSLSQMSMALSP